MTNLKINLKKVLPVLFMGVVFFNVGSVNAATIFFDNELDWLTATEHVENFLTNSGNMATANEVNSAPNISDDLGSTLTFDSTNTELSIDFQLRALQPNHNFLFDYPSGYSVSDYLDVGRLNTFEHDDWEIEFLNDSSIFGFGFTLISNNSNSGESFSVFGESNTFLGSTQPLAVSGVDMSFLGVISTDRITRILFDEDSGGDDIGIRNFLFATPNPVPEPSTMLLFGIGLVGLVFCRRRRFNLQA